MKARCSYSVTTWDEHPYDESSAGRRLTKASVEYRCTGEIDGTAAVEYLMSYSHYDAKEPHSSLADYVGMIGFQGKLKERAGSFVLIDRGTFRGGTASSELQIADGSGTGALAGIKGTGSYRADRNGCQMELEYELP